MGCIRKENRLCKSKRRCAANVGALVAGRTFVNSVVRIPVSHQSGKGRSGYGFDRLFLRHHAAAGQLHGVDSRFNHRVHIFCRRLEAVTRPEACLLRVVVISAQPSELVRMERVIGRAKDAAEHTHRVFECPRTTCHHSNHAALLSDQCGLGLEMWVFGSFSLEPTGARYRNVSARRKTNDHNDVLGANNLRKPRHSIKDGCRYALNGTVDRSLKVLRVHQNGTITCFDPWLSHDASEIAQADNGSFAHAASVLTTSMAQPGISSTEAVAHWLPQWLQPGAALRLNNSIRGTSP
ncbi:hypothetical protein KLPMCK402M_25985 [Klebsiella pneumoniae]